MLLMQVGDRDVPINKLMSLNMNNGFVKGTALIDPGMVVFCDNEGSFVKNVVLASTSENTITAILPAMLKCR